VLVDGSSVGAVASHTFTDVQAGHTIAASFVSTVTDRVAAAPAPGAAITTQAPCLSVPVVFTRTDATPLRAYSVTLELSPNLVLCGAQVTSAGYPLAPQDLLVTPLPGNRWKIDEVTLGSPCGATGSGTLFYLSLAGSEPAGTGTVTVVSVVARDCNNDPIPASAGSPATILIDQEGPARTLDLVATQLKTGNAVPPPASHGTTAIRLDFSLPVDAASVEVYRRAFGHYPQYDEAGGAAPPTPSSLPGAGWVLTGVTAPGQTDEPAARDFWYYALVSRDSHGNVSSVSNMTAGTLNYHLGDFSNGLATCDGDALVGTADVSLLGANYGSAVGVGGALECVDIGPTTDLSVNGRPTTDNHLEFEDLMMVALNYGAVSAPQAPARAGRAASSDAGPDRLILGTPAHVTAGETFAVPLVLEANGGLQGLSVELTWNPAVCQPLQVESGQMFEGAGGVLFASGPAAVDGALLGARDPGLTGSAAFATVTFQALASGDAGIDAARVRARDRDNHVAPLVVVATASAEKLPLRTMLAAARPNPFRSGTVLEYELARGGPAELSLFGIDGRRVRTLSRGAQQPGTYRFTWDGSDDQGQRVKAGVYFARLTTVAGRFTQTVVLVK
jgi:hypothetical protein